MCWTRSSIPGLERSYKWGSPVLEPLEELLLVTWG